ncbi:MAG: PaeR7I family type II restriction endonuclease [Maioricimonas sp. JB049]
MKSTIDLDARVREAIRHFWLTRAQQAQRQGEKTGRRDSGLRTAVTGGKQLDGFVELCRDILLDAGLDNAEVGCRNQLHLPGYFRPSKEWDLLAVADGQLVAVVEFKAHIGPSFSNNFNNRTEEALGSAVDVWAAYREGAFKPSARPWLGYVMVLEDCPKARSPVKVRGMLFNPFPEFEGTSYADRYDILLTKMIRERLYDAASFIMTPREAEADGAHSYPNVELSFRNFATSLHAHASSFVELRRS